MEEEDQEQQTQLQEDPQTSSEYFQECQQFIQTLFTDFSIPQLKQFLKGHQYVRK